jgi:hypothetical protein
MERHRSRGFHSVIGRVAAIVLIMLVFGIPAFSNEMNKAIEKGDLEKVKALLKANPELISQKGGGILNQTPLQDAVFSRQTTIAEFLLANGADVDTKDRSGDTVLGTALWGGNYAMADILRLFEGKGGKADLTPLMAAALSCDSSQVSALLLHGADIKARDSAGNDALSFAAVNRNKDLSLKCPDVVSELVKAGADPWTARYYQTPDFQERKPSRIAILRVEDIRTEKDENSKVAEKFTDGIEHALSQSRARVAQVTVPHYPISTLAETRDKLAAAGFQGNNLTHPDRKRACAALGVDAVFEAIVKDYGHGFLFDGNILGSHGESSLEYWLTDCRSGELMWKSDPGVVGEKRGFVVKGFVNGFTMICEQTIILPRYDAKSGK